MSSLKIQNADGTWSYILGNENLDNVDNTSDLEKPISTATQKALDEKVDKENGKMLSSNDFTSEEKEKLSGIATGANNYIHPTFHDPSVISQDSNNRFVSDAEKTTWNSKASLNSPTFTGTPTVPTPSITSNNNQIATTSFVQSVVDSSKNKTAILIYPSVTNGYQNGAYSYFDRFTVVNDSLGEVNGYLITPKNSGWYQFFGQFGFWLNRIQTYGRFDLGIEENPINSNNLGKTVTNSNGSSTYSQDKNIYTSTQYITHSNFHKLAYLRAGQDYRISIFCALNGISGAIDIGLGATYFAITRI